MEPINITVLIMGGVSVGMILFGVIKWIMTPQEKTLLSMDPPASKDKVEYCRSCGARKILHQGQDGYHTRTGLPSLITYLACPDWDEKAWTASYHARLAISGYFTQPPRDCENRVRLPIQATYVHNGHADGDVSVVCPRCIIDMERAEIISHEDADRRLKEIA